MRLFVFWNASNPLNRSEDLVPPTLSRHSTRETGEGKGLPGWGWKRVKTFSNMYIMYAMSIVETFNVHILAPKFTGTDTTQAAFWPEQEPQRLGLPSGLSLICYKQARFWAE